MMPSDEIENAEEFEQSFLSGLQGDEESGIIQRGNPAETTDTAKTAQTQSVAAETSADPGVEAVVQQYVEAVEMFGGKVESEILGLMPVLQMNQPDDTGENVRADSTVALTDEGRDQGVRRYAKHRPDYGKNQVEMVWELEADSKTGMVKDPSGICFAWDRTKPRKGQWDMGHRPGQRYADKHALYMADKMSEADFLKWYRDPNNYRPELPSTNRSHKYE